MSVVTFLKKIVHQNLADPHSRYALKCVGFWLLVLFVGWIYTSQHIFAANFLAKEGKEFVPISFFEPDDFSVVAHRLREPIDGNWLVSDTDLFEFRNAPSVWPLANPIIAAPLYFLFATPHMGYMMGQMPATVAAFCILYLLFIRLMPNKIVAVCAAMILIIFPKIGVLFHPHNFEEVRSLIKQFIPWNFFGFGKDMFYSVWSESVFPSLPFFFGAIYLLYRALEKKTLRSFLIAGAANGFLFYTYMPNGAYVFATAGVAGVYALVHRDYKLTKYLLAYAGIFGMVTSFFWYNFIQINQLPYAEEIRRRVGIEISNGFRTTHIYDFVSYGLLALLAMWYSKKTGNKAAAHLIVSAMVAQVVIMNMQMVIGFNLMPSVWESHEFYILNATGLFLGIGVLFSYLKTSRGKIIATGCIALLTLSMMSRALITEYELARVTYATRTIEPATLDAMQWLQENTPTDSVVITPSLATSATIPALTHNRVFVPYSMNTLASKDETLNRFLIANQLFGVPVKHVSDVLTVGLNGMTPLTKNNGNRVDDFDVWGNYNLFGFIDFDSSPTAWFKPFGSNEVYVKNANVYRDSAVARYEAMRKSAVDVGQRKIDYVYVGHYEKSYSTTDFDAVSYAQKVYSANDISIYTIDQNKIK